MSIYAERPWLDRYDPGQPPDIDVEFASALAMFDACVARDPDAPIIRYLGGVLTRRDLDELSGAFAAALANAEFAAGERVALYLQNVPQFVIAMLGAWKAGGIAVAVNPMNKERELEEILRDSGAAVLVCHEDLYTGVAGPIIGGTDVRMVITTSALDYQTRDDDRVLGGVRRLNCDGTQDMAALIERFGGRPLPVADVPPLGPDDVAFLTYTSGTTGPPKGAMTTHRNIVFNAQTYRDWIGIGPRDVILGVAPLFHIAGSIGHVAVSLLTGATLVLTYRFDPAVAIETIRDEKVTFTVGSITVFIALMNAPNADSGALATLTKIYSGGAPIPLSTVTAFTDTYGTTVTVIPCGAMTADLTWLLLAPGRSIRRRQDRNLPPEWVDVPTHCVLVDTPDGRLLWDTSCPRDWEQRWAPTGLQDFFPYEKVSEDEYLDSRLKQLGITPGELDYVVFSHLHFDHAGNAQLFKETNARLVCSEAEKEWAFGFEGPFNGAHLKTDYAGLDFETVSGDAEFLPGVSFIQTPGHTPGSMSLRVDLPETGTMIFTADAVYMGASYGPPAVPAAIVNNLEQFYSSVEKLRGIAASSDATLVFGHDPDQIQQLRVAPTGSYR